MNTTKALMVTVCLVLLGTVYSGLCQDQVVPTQGTLQVITPEGQSTGGFPLKHTEVNVDVSGYIAYVEVKQYFTNPYQDPIEAVYVFPLPQNAAVNDMTIKVGDRTIRGEIKEREEARKIYEQARDAGHITAILEQERPNIFTQSVANIIPGDEIEVTIKYVQVLNYDEGKYEYVFPMVVGPRFIPGTPNDTPSDGGWAQNTDKVPDASRITPPVLKPGERSGHDINVTVNINAGVNIYEVTSVSHKIDVSRNDESSVNVKLHPQDRIPNKDLIIRYKVAGDKPQYALLTHRIAEEGYYLLMIQPKEKYATNEITPKELIFVIDCSGSMSGKPIEKAKEVIRRFLKGMNSNDTFQIIRFSEKASGLSAHPVKNTPENVKKALQYIDSLSGQGGTMMIEGIKAALDYPYDSNRLRVVAFLTDGYIGNETEILAAIQDKLGGARLFSFGVGTSVNRYLLDRMAETGKGIVQYVRPDEDTYEVVEKFYRRINNPCLTDIEISYRGVEVADTYPENIPDLFDSQPLFIYGKYTGAGEGLVILTARASGRTVKIKVPVEFPEENKENESIATIWARQKIRDLMSRQYHGEREDLVKRITEIALKYRLMSQYTSFVAVEENFVIEAGERRKVLVPVPIPEYVSYEGIFGKEECMDSYTVAARSPRSKSYAQLSYLPSEISSRGILTEAEKSGVVINEDKKVSQFFLSVVYKDKNLLLNVESNGYVFKTGSDGRRLLVKKLSSAELDGFRKLLLAMNLSRLDKKVFKYGEKVEIVVSMDEKSAKITLDPSSGTMEPTNLHSLLAYLDKIIH